MHQMWLHVIAIRTAKMEHSQRGYEVSIRKIQTN